MSKQTAVAYVRVSSAVNVGDDKDSVKRQLQAVRSYARSHALEIVEVFEDLAVSGADMIEDRPGFSAMLEYLLGNGARTILIETASRFARDVLVQELGYKMLVERGIRLIPTDAPEHFANDESNPTRELVRVILGAVSAFEKKGLVRKLRAARDRRSAEIGRRVEGRPPFAPEVVKLAKRLHRPNRRTGERWSLRAISAELAAHGYLGATGKPYVPESVARMLEK